MLLSVIFIIFHKHAFNQFGFCKMWELCLSTVMDIPSSTFCVILFQVHYTSENVIEGKSYAKRALQEKLELHQTDAPLVGIISRLTAQKGIHLIKHAIYRTLERNGQVLSCAYWWQIFSIASLLCVFSWHLTFGQLFKTKALCLSSTGGSTRLSSRSSHTKWL